MIIPPPRISVSIAGIGSMPALTAALERDRCSLRLVTALIANELSYGFECAHVCMGFDGL